VKIARFCGLPGGTASLSVLSAGNPNLPLEIKKIRRIFKFPADVSFFQQKIWISRGKIYFPADFLIFRLNFRISSGRSRVPLEI